MSDGMILVGVTDLDYGFSAHINMAQIVAMVPIPELDARQKPVARYDDATGRTVFVARGTEVFLKGGPSLRVKETPEQLMQAMLQLIQQVEGAE